MKIGARDDFEHRYMGKFRALAAPHGVFVEYERDRAGRDIGLQLTRPSQTSDGSITTPALLWFQMKGIMAKTLTRRAYEYADDVAIDLDTSHLRFWYMSVLPTYLAVYVESADQFLAIDITKWVAEHYGDEILKLEQGTVRVRVDKKNVLDGDFFRVVLNRNLVPVLRKSFAQEDDKAIERFLRDCSVVQWLTNCREEGRAARVTVVKWMSKMRTEVYFENETEDGDWKSFRTHWQYSMGDLAVAFPYLTFLPGMKAEMFRWSEIMEDFDGVPFEVWHDGFSVTEVETGDELDEDEFDGECLLDLGNGEYSYGEMGGGEMIRHRLGLELNEVGERWAATLKVLVDAEVLSVDVEPHMISVAPWHARDV
jgi:hypothetical protein